MVSTQVTDLIRERDSVISARHEALARWVKGAKPYKSAIFYEYVQPLTNRLNTLNKALGL